MLEEQGGMGCEMGGKGGQGGMGWKGETYEEKISPRNAFSFPIKGSVFVNSV